MHAMVSRHESHSAFGMYDLGWHSTHQMRLDVIDDKPIFCSRHRLSRVEWDIVDEKVAEFSKYGLVEQATGSYAGAIVLPVKKDADGIYTDRRMCGDYRMLNFKTEQDRYPMPIP